MKERERERAKHSSWDRTNRSQWVERIVAFWNMYASKGQCDMWYECKNGLVAELNSTLFRMNGRWHVCNEYETIININRILWGISITNEWTIDWILTSISHLKKWIHNDWNLFKFSGSIEPDPLKFRNTNKNLNFVLCVLFFFFSFFFSSLVVYVHANLLIPKTKSATRPCEPCEPCEPFRQMILNIAS